jgi:phospholipid/cholesterol/gamma-HCH transport system permease protein
MVRQLTGVLLVFRILLDFHWLFKPAVVQVVVKQIYFSGIMNLLWVVVLAVSVGALMVYSVVTFARQVGDMSWVGVMIHSLLIQEAAPLIVVLLLLTRSGVAIITEIGQMHVRGEHLTLQSIGVSIEEFLFLPRLIAFVLSGVVLTLVFTSVSVWVGGVIVSLNKLMPLSDYVFQLNQHGSLTALLILLAKSTLYPLVTCMILLDQGSRVGIDPNQLPVRTTTGVYSSLMTVFFLEVTWIVIGLML